MFSAHGVKVSLVYSEVVKRKCKRSKCWFLEFYMYSTYETCFIATFRKQNRLTFHRCQVVFWKKTLYLSHISSSAFLLYPQYQNNNWTVIGCNLTKIVSIIYIYIVFEYLFVCTPDWYHHQSNQIKPIVMDQEIFYYIIERWKFLFLNVRRGTY